MQKTTTMTLKHKLYTMSTFSYANFIFVH